MESCLQAIKLKVEECITLSPFAPNHLSLIFCDASRSGVSYLFMQVLNDKWFFIRYGSTPFSPSQTKYSTYDQELVTLSFACVNLSNYLSSGLHFTLLTDCSALRGLEMIDITTTQLHRTLRCLERILSHNVPVVHTSNKYKKVADYLSCNSSGTSQFPDLKKYTKYQQKTSVVNLVFGNHQ